MVETSMDTHNLVKTIEKSYSGLLVIHQRSVHHRIVLRWSPSHTLSKCASGKYGLDIYINSQGWVKSLLEGNVYNIYEVKTIMTIVLTFKSDMDYHTIR